MPFKISMKNGNKWTLWISTYVPCSQYYLWEMLSTCFACWILNRPFRERYKSLYSNFLLLRKMICHRGMGDMIFVILQRRKKLKESQIQLEKDSNTFYKGKISQYIFFIFFILHILTEREWFFKNSKYLFYKWNGISFGRYKITQINKYMH